MKENKLFNVKTLVIIGFMAGLSYVLMLLHSPFKYLGFLEVELSDIPAVVCGFAYGPMVGVLVELIKNLIKALTATTTGGVGELANFLIISGYVFPSCYLYRTLKMSEKAKNWTAYIVGTIGLMVVGILVNYFITVPMYAKIFGFDTVIKMGQSTIPAIKGLASFVVLGITPFNLFKGVYISIISFFVYKKFKNVLR